jgi:arylsulfatase A-like enzyme
MSAQTPFLKKLALEGIAVMNMRTVMPHTTKSNFAMLCGKYPSMQQNILETADNYAMKCIPDILTSKGYSTAWFQTAHGQFENRPRLTRNLGYTHFEALQNLKPMPQPLGYLAGDDAGIIKPVLNWTQKQKKPFFIQIMTSATHHPYEIPLRIIDDGKHAEAGKMSQIQRYLFLVSQFDKVLEQLVGSLQKQNPSRDLVVIVTGDHGEAFGEHGGFQHDNIYWEEGLHVPFVIWSPKRIKPGQIIKQERSLIDVAPTVLNIANISYDASLFDGRTLLKPEKNPIRRYFACWYSNVCAGFVQNNKKFIYLPSSQSWIVYDLTKDPFEKTPQIEPEKWRRQAKETRDWYMQHQHSDDGLVWTPSILYDSWKCADEPRKCWYLKKK